MDSPRITYAPHPDASTSGETTALASVYTFVLQKHEARQKGTRPGAPDDPERRSNDIRAGISIPEKE